MDKIEVELEEVSLKKPVLIEGLPGLGWVGWIACEHLIKELGAKKLGYIYSPDLPPQVLINPDGTVRMMRHELHYHKNPDLIILIGDHQGMLPSSHYHLAGKAIDIAQKYGTEMIYTLGGFGVGSVIKKPRVFGAVTHKEMTPKLAKHGIVFEHVHGSIVGAAGLLLGLGKLRGMRGVCLMGETHGNYVDPKAARNVLEVVCKVLNLDIDLSKLDKKAKEAADMVKKLEEQQKQRIAPPPVTGPPEEGPSAYIR